MSENDLECLRVFNRKLKEKDVKRAILGENIHEFNCKAEYFIPNDDSIFQISKRESKSRSQKNNFTRKVEYLIHSVHDISDLSNIFTPNGIRLKGKSSQRDFYGLPLIWFGIYNEKDKQPKSRYGSFSFKIKIENNLICIVCNIEIITKKVICFVQS